MFYNDIEYKFDYYMDRYNMNKYINDYYMIDMNIEYAINNFWYVIKIECGICNICIKFENRIDRDRCQEKLIDIIKLEDYNIIETFIKQYNGIIKED